MQSVGHSLLSFTSRKSDWIHSTSSLEDLHLGCVETCWRQVDGSDNHISHLSLVRLGILNIPLTNRNWFPGAKTTGVTALCSIFDIIFIDSSTTEVSCYPEYRNFRNQKIKLSIINQDYCLHFIDSRNSISRRE